MIYYLWDFVFFSFMGWCIDEVYYLITEKKFANRGFLSSPLCPMYGFASVIIDFCFSNILDQPWFIFFGSMLILGVLKFLVSLFLDKFLHSLL